MHKQATRRSSIEIDRTIHQLAAKGNGIVATDRLRRLGFNDKVITNRLRSGALVRVAPGVVALGGTAITPMLRSFAVSMVHPTAWVSHTAAALMWKATIDERVVQAEVTSVHPDVVRVSGVVGHRTRFAPGRLDVVRHGAGRVSRPELCVVELSEQLDARHVELALDSLIHAGSLSLRRLASMLEMWSTARHGLGDLREIVDDRLHGSGIVRSWLEQDAMRVIARAGLPAPKRNHTIRLRNGSTRTLDLAWPELRVAVEADSWAHHASASDWRRTRIRDRQLAAEGWIIVPCVVTDTRDPTAFLLALLETLDRARSVTQKGG